LEPKKKHNGWARGPWEEGARKKPWVGSESGMDVSEGGPGQTTNVNEGSEKLGTDVLGG